MPFVLTDHFFVGSPLNVFSYDLQECLSDWMTFHTQSKHKGAHLYELSGVQSNFLSVWRISHKHCTYAVCGLNKFPWSLKYNHHYQQQEQQQPPPKVVKHCTLCWTVKKCAFGNGERISTLWLIWYLLISRMMMLSFLYYIQSWMAYEVISTLVC